MFCFPLHACRIVLPFERYIPWRKISAKIWAGNTANLFKLLKMMSKERLQEAQIEGRQWLPHLVWNGDPHTNAAGMVLLELACLLRPNEPDLLCKAPWEPVGFDAWL